MHAMPSAHAQGQPSAPDGAQNYRYPTLTALDDLRTGTARFGANVEAIRSLRKLEREARPATFDEQHILARYTGFGSADVIDRAFENRGFGPLKSPLAELVRPHEAEAIRGSTLNAHYTPLVITGALWQTLLGVWNDKPPKGLRVLEPAVGAGYFLSTMPEAFSEPDVWAVELDTISAEITAKLHPSARVFARGFETVDLPANVFDLAISNVPFGKYGVHDVFERDARLKASIHTYYFVKALRVVKPGGLIAFITSRYTLDSKDPYVRERLAEQADLIAVARLPTGAFDQIAGTQVVADVLILRKRSSATGGAGIAGWVDTTTLQLPGPGSQQVEINVNRALADHREWVIGEMNGHGKLAHGAPDLGVSFRGGRHGGTRYDGRCDARDVAELLQTILEQQLRAQGHTCAVDGVTNAGTIAGDIDTSTARAVSNAVTSLIPLNTAFHSSGLAAFDTIPNGADRGGADSAEDEFARGCQGLVTLTRDERRMRCLQTLYAAAKAVIFSELRGLPDASVDEARRRLNDAYDEWLWQFGELRRKKTFQALKGHFAQPFLEALEVEDEHGRITQAAIFRQRTVRPQPPERAPADAHDALVMSKARSGCVDLTWMAAALHVPVDEVITQLGDAVFFDPDQGTRPGSVGTGGTWVTDDEYLSGNVVKKLRLARAAAEFIPALARNVVALEAAQPPPLAPRDITARLGVPWLPVDVVREFVKTLAPKVTFKLGFAVKLGKWSIEPESDWQVQHSVEATQVWGTARMHAFQILDHVLNAKDIEITDPDPKNADKEVRNATETTAAEAKADEIQARFEIWVWEDETRAERLAAIYNETFNCLRARRFDGQFLTFPGLSVEREPWPNQKDAVWRILQSKNTLIGHFVGHGKSAIGTIAIAESLRMGLVNKAMCVVPNHIIGQWRNEIRELYPHLKLLVAGPDDLTKDNRQRFMARVTTGDAEVIVVTYEQFKALPVRPETEALFIQRELDEITDALGQAEDDDATPRGTIKDLMRAKKRCEARLLDLVEIKRDDARTITFDELGIDMLLADEFHVYKNLSFVTNRKRIAGLPNSHADRSLDMLLKIRMLQAQGKRVVGLSATPIANTIAEAYTFLRYFLPDLLEEAGLAAFDPWCANFARTQTSVEVAPDGSGFRLNTRLSKWHNLPELALFCRQALDISTHALPVPKPKMFTGKPLPVVLPMSKRLKRMVGQFVRRAEACRQSGADQRVDNMLKITGDARHASIDPRLIEPGPEFALCKINAVAQTAWLIWRASEPRRGTQMIFCDIGVPKPKKTKNKQPRKPAAGRLATEGDGNANAEVEEDDEGNEGTEDDLFETGIGGLKNRVYGLIKDKLIKAGVPTHEIAFIHDADSRAKRDTLFADMNAGRVRVLIGSTSKMGTGTNAQRQMIALHNLDVPWRPDQITQRIGRIARPGNEYDTVFVFNYETEGSFDAYSWQVNETKAGFIEPFMAGEVTARTAEDISEFVLSLSELKGWAAGNPLVQKQVQLKAELHRLDRLRHAWLDACDMLRRDLHRLPEQIARLKQRLGAMRAAVVERDRHMTAPFTMTLRRSIGNGVENTLGDVEHAFFTGREDAGAHLMQLAEALRKRLVSSQKRGVTQDTKEQP